MFRKHLFVPLFVLFAVSMTSAQTPQAPQPPCVPGISFWNLLESVRVGYVDGRLRIDRLYAPCLPNPARQSTSAYAYDPDVGGSLTTVVKTADGKELNTYVWYGERLSSLWELSRYKVLGGHQSTQQLAAGNYVLEFAANDKPFYRFPFVIVEGKNEDPYQPAGPRYYIEGPWNEYGNIFYQRNDPQSVLKFTTWVQDQSGRPKTAYTPYELKLINLKDGKVVAEDSGSFRLEPRWQKADLLLHPAGDKAAYLRAGDFLSTDGRYAFRFTLDGKPYGNYPFEVKGGRIQFQGRQIREKTDPMIVIVDYLSGGRYTSWWIRKE